MLLFTSGTTSEPKAAILRHRHLVSYIISSVEFLGCEPTEAQLICVPSYHIAGIAAVLSSLYAGRRIMYLPAFEATAWVHLAADEHITHAMVVPTMLGRILSALEEGGRRAAGPAPPLLRRRAHAARARRAHPDRHAPHRPRQRVRADRDQFHHRHAHPRRAPRGLRQRRPGHPGAAGFGRATPPVPRGGGARHRRGGPASGREGRDLGARRAGGRRVRRADHADRGRLVPHPGRRLVRRARLLVRRRPAGRCHRAGGGEHLAGGDRGSAHGAHRGRRGGGDRHPRRRVGRGGGGRGRAARGGEASETELQVWVRERLRSTKMPAVVAFRDELPYSPTGKLLRRVLRDELSGSGPA